MLVVLLWLVALGLILRPAPARPVSAQGPCGTVDALDFPVDPASFQIIFGYNLPSSRFDGRLHVGEDWIGESTATYGAPVRAIARGRVTYAAPLGWGRDKGVVIVEHLMPDGTIWYSFYGHLEEIEDITFPTIYTCVERGDIVGAIGRPRPAPHLHFEIRNFWPDSPGPGYWGTDPTLEGWRRPSKFILNWQTWLNPAYRWHADISDESGPHWPAVIRDDGATLLYDENRLLALNTSGQVIWRYILEEDLTIVGVLPYGEDIIVATQDGALQLWSQSGGFVEAWVLAHGIDAPPLTWGDLLIVHSPGDALIAYGPDRIERWRVPDVPRPTAMQATPTLLAATLIRSEVMFFSRDGDVIGRAALRRQGDLAPAPDSGFYVRSQYGLWHVSTGGVWRLLGDAPPVQFASSTLYSLPDGRFYLFTGPREGTLHAYAGQGTPLWTLSLPDLEGNALIFNDGGGALLLADGYGHALVVGADTGALCNQLHAWGNRAAGSWAGLGADGVLRLHIADQVLGLDWATFAAGCQ